MIWIAIVVSFAVGTATGVIMMGIMAAASRNDEMIDRLNESEHPTREKKTD